jgi:hypothetical protein
MTRRVVNLLASDGEADLSDCSIATLPYGRKAASQGMIPKYMSETWRKWNKRSYWLLITLVCISRDIATKSTPPMEDIRQEH